MVFRSSRGKCDLLQRRFGQGGRAFAAPKWLSPRRSLWRSLGRPRRRINDVHHALEDGDDGGFVDVEAVFQFLLQRELHGRFFYHEIDERHDKRGIPKKALRRSSATARLPAMKAMLDTVTKEALDLSTDEQEMLAEKLVGNVVAHVPAAIKRQQLAEVMRRREEVLSGKTAGVSAEQVLREIQGLIR
jgi:putative addiction module component (TIGR02574 family)